MAREVLAVTGAAIGFVASGGNPQGAAIGFNIGYGVGSYLDPIKIPHPGLNDAPIQTSRDGVPIPLVWGLNYVHGNIIQKNPEEIVTTTERQGKGGGPEVETKQRFRTFAIGVGQSTIGTLAEVTRIWENGKLVYDVRATPAITAEETAAYAENITIYLGGEDQLPDPELEAHWGANDTPAYRGLCYIVWNNYELTDTGGAIPQFAFEVNGSKNRTITSKPYPIEGLEGVLGTPNPVDWENRLVPIDGVDVGITPLVWAINTLLNSFDYTEGVDVSIAPQSWLVETRLESYSYTEGVDVAITPQSWIIVNRLVSYDYEDEGVNASITPLTWTIT